MPQGLKAWEMESSSGEQRDLDLQKKKNRKGVMESNKNQHSLTLTIPAQFEQYHTKPLYLGVFKQKTR